MSKKDKQSNAEDYLAQVEWENDHPFDKRGRPSVKYEPKWKYKRIRRIVGDGSSFSIGVLLIAAIATIGYLLSLIFVYRSSNGIFPGVLILTIIIILYFVIRDLEKHKKR